MYCSMLLCITAWYNITFHALSDEAVYLPTVFSASQSLIGSQNYFIEYILLILLNIYWCLACIQHHLNDISISFCNKLRLIRQSHVLHHILNTARASIFQYIHFVGVLLQSTARSIHFGLDACHFTIKCEVGDSDHIY